jgi:hypothetical protein
MRASVTDYHIDHNEQPKVRVSSVKDGRMYVAVGGLGTGFAIHGTPAQLMYLAVAIREGIAKATGVDTEATS